MVLRECSWLTLRSVSGRLEVRLVHEAVLSQVIDSFAGSHAHEGRAVFVALRPVL